MAQIDAQMVEAINQPGRIGVLATADASGQPNAAYFGSPRLNPDGTLVMGLMKNRSLANLEANPKAVFFVAAEAPVTFTTPGWRLYLSVAKIDRDGEVLAKVREAIAAKAGAQAAQAIQAGVVFQVEEVRALVAMG